MKNNKIIITVAPVSGNVNEVPAGAHNPLSPEDIARDVINCARAGASMVHLHNRNEKGEQAVGLATYPATIALLRKESDIIINGSTFGGGNLSLEDRCIVVKEPRTQVASLNMGSVDMGEGANINLLSDIRYFIDRMKEANIKPELECFEFGMIHSCIRLAKEGLLSKPLNFNFTLGFDGALPDDPAYLAPIVERLPQGANWGFVHHGMTDLRMHAAALSLGAVMLRVGYEDGYYYAPGKVAASNAVLVEKLAELVHCLGFEVASPAEARKILGVEKL